MATQQYDTAKFWSQVDKRGACWLWLGRKHQKGYGMFGNRKAHHVAYEIEHGPVPKGLWVLHTCDNRWCVNPSHIYAGTATDNNRDTVRRGRHVVSRGEANGRSTIPESVVEEIRHSLEVPAIIAKRLGVSESAVFMIRSGQRRAAPKL